MCNWPIVVAYTVNLFEYSWGRHSPNGDGSTGLNVMHYSWWYWITTNAVPKIKTRKQHSWRENDSTPALNANFKTHLMHRANQNFFHSREMPTSKNGKILTQLQITHRYSKASKYNIKIKTYISRNISALHQQTNNQCWLWRKVQGQESTTGLFNIDWSNYR